MLRDQVRRAPLRSLAFFKALQEHADGDCCGEPSASVLEACRDGRLDLLLRDGGESRGRSVTTIVNGIACDTETFIKRLHAQGWDGEYTIEDNTGEGTCD